MSHHSSSKSMDDHFKQQMEIEAQQLGLGATKRTPSGLLNNSDEGEIRFGIAHDAAKRKVFINFGKPVAWVGMSPEEASEFGQMLIDHAMKCRGIVP